MEKAFDKQQIRRSRIIAVVLASSMIVTFVSIIYSFTLSQEVERISNEASAVKALAEKYRLEAEQVAAEANMKLATALEALDECKANPK